MSDKQLRTEIVNHLGQPPEPFMQWFDGVWDQIKDSVGAVAHADGYRQAAKDVRNLYACWLQQGRTGTNP